MTDSLRLITAMQDTVPQKENADERVARKFGQSPDAVRMARERYNEDPLIHAILNERIEVLIVAKARQLETVEPDNLKSVQGELRAFRQALSCINQRE